jgi:hypothetical protein
MRNQKKEEVVVVAAAAVVVAVVVWMINHSMNVLKHKTFFLMFYIKTSNYVM